MLGLDPWVLAACIAIVFVGSTVQATVGIGMGLIAAPLLVTADPDFVPGAILIAVVPLSVGVVAAEHDRVDWRGCATALVGRVPGTVLGAVAVAVMSERALAVLIAGTVLAAVGVSLAGVRFATTTRSLLVAGVASGFGGTATGVGGPPMALTYQRQDPATLRATLAVFFLAGSALSIATLIVTGEIESRQLRLATALVPGVIAGVLVARPLRRRLDPSRIRGFVLALCVAAAVTLLVDTFA
ncbi:sulfite exporter TauE/SafE family protein [soil metagenome]